MYRVITASDEDWRYTSLALSREDDAKSLQSYVEGQLRKLLEYRPPEVKRYFNGFKVSIEFHLSDWESKFVKSGATLKKWVRESKIDVSDATVKAFKMKHLSGWSSEGDGYDYTIQIEYNSLDYGPEYDHIFNK